MRIQILSDLHLENPAAYDLFEISPVAPHLALLGDIGHTNDEGLFAFLRQQLQNFETVLFISGNHEPYHSSIPESNNRLLDFQNQIETEREAAAENAPSDIGRFIILNQTRFDLSPTVTILGCTLFSQIISDQKDNVSFGMNDFYYIEDWTIEDHGRNHRADVAWLNDEISRITAVEPARQIVVLSHYSPTIDPRSVDPAHSQSKISSGFMTNLHKERCWSSSGNVKVWAFGHTHYNCDFLDESTGKRIVTNQRGYYFSQSDGFKSEKVIEI